MWCGHQAREEGALRAVGVDPAQLDERLPLPWFQVLVGAYLAVAQADTSSFLAAITLAGGGAGELVGPSRPGDRPTDVPAGRARRLLAEIPSVTAFGHRSVVESVVLLTEMAERAWGLLLDLHEDPRHRCLAASRSSPARAALSAATGNGGGPVAGLPGARRVTGRSAGRGAAI